MVKYNRFSRVKEIQIILLFFFLWLEAIAQNQPLFSCNYFDTRMQVVSCIFYQGYYQYDLSAQQAVEKILKPIGLPQNFILVKCPNISNAVALTGGDGNRYIVYDSKFMGRVNNITTDWSSISILAHEIGHHLSGHTIKKASSAFEQQQREIEADEFAGFVLFKLGATLEQAQAPIVLLSENVANASSTHPAKDKRLFAMKVGFEKAKMSANLEYAVNNESPEKFFDQGNRLFDDSNFIAAIIKYTVAIELNSRFAFAYANRALAKMQLDKVNWTEVVSDCDKAIDIEQNLGAPYYYRGFAKIALKDYGGAKDDLDRSIMLDSTFNGRGYSLYNSFLTMKLSETKNDAKAEEYFNSGITNASKNLIPLAIRDFSEAIRLDGKNPKYFDCRGYAYFQVGKTKEAFEDITKAIELNPTMPVPYYHRGMLYASLDSLNKAVIDFNAAILFDPDNVDYLMKCGFARRQTDDFVGALNIFNKILAKDKFNDNALLERAITYRFLNNLENAFADLREAIRLNPTSPYNYYHLGFCFFDEKKEKEGCLNLKKSCDLGLEDGCIDFKEYCK